MVLHPLLVQPGVGGAPDVVGQGVSADNAANTEQKACKGGDSDDRARLGPVGHAHEAAVEVEPLPPPGLQLLGLGLRLLELGLVCASQHEQL